MGLGNSPRRQTVLTLEACKSFAFGVKFRKAADKSPVDLTGAAVRLVVSEPSYKGGAQLLDLDAELLDAALGLAQFNLQAAALDLAPGEYPFSVTLVSQHGYSTLILKGVVDLQENNESESALVTYPGINPSTTLAAYLESGDLVQVEVDHIDGMYVIVDGLIQNFTAEVQAKNDAHTAEVQVIADQASNYANNAAMEADEAAGHAMLAAQSATDANAAADRAASVTSGSTDPVVADLVANPTSATNNAVEALIGSTPPSTHNHDGRYYTEAEIDEKLQALPVSGHTHDDRYYTETEIDTKLGEITGGAIVQPNEPVLAEGEFWYDTDDEMAAGLDGTGFRMTRSGKDANKVFTTIEYRRPDNTLALRSVLSGGTSPTYTTRTVTEYAGDGTTVVLTTTYTLTYDGDGDLTSEAFA